PRRVEARLQTLLRPRVSAARQGRPLPRAQRRQQTERDGRLSRRDRTSPFPLDDDRVAVRRGDLDFVQAMSGYSRATTTGAVTFFGARFLRGLPGTRRPAGTGSSLGSSFDMLVRNFFTPCSSNCTRV